MFYDSCAGCGTKFDGIDVVVMDGRALCPACIKSAANTNETATTPAVSERPRFTVRIARDAKSPGSGFFAEANEWCQGKMWLPRLVLLVWFASLFWKLLRDPLAWLLIDGLNLGIHELGHYAFYWLGEFASVLGGSLLEVIAPIGAGIMFYRQRDFFAIGVASCWLGTALFDVGSYAGDARARELPLVSPTSSDPEHDWFYILLKLDMLEHDHTIMSLLHFAGAAAMVAGLLFGGWLILQMKNARPD